MILCHSAESSYVVFVKCKNIYNDHTHMDQLKMFIIEYILSVNSWQNKQ